MSDISVQLKDGVAVLMPPSATVAEALKKLDRDLAKQALAAKVEGHEVDLAHLDAIPGVAAQWRIRSAVGQIDPVLPQTRDGLRGLAAFYRHLLAAAVRSVSWDEIGVGPPFWTIALRLFL